ncbi:MAG: HlyC/CorC family transporter [Treponema sp.]|uniref:hemolysin family protein n=1 Tax=Treponema sp. TaxID=166 RepID=UPI00298EBB05|nr:hemolysin family protein [Treponema sp.]MBR5934297.1 HlyC/CorC family transporter [Treponema sp.]
MPAGSWSLLISLIILVFFSGFFSATETAYSCASKIKLRTLLSNGNKRAGAVLNLTEKHYDRLLSTILIGNNIVNLSASAISTLFFAMIILDSKLDSTVVSTAVITVAVLIFGEITPKYIAKTYPEKVSMAFYPVVILFYYILYPINIIFSAWKFIISHVFKLNREEIITEDEIMTFVEEAQEDGTLKKDETNLIRSVIEFDDLEVEDILTPRVNIAAVDIKSSLDEIKMMFQRTGFSRLPVYKGSIDSIIGIIHEKDFYNLYVNDKRSITEVMQEAYFTTEHTKISKLLRTLQVKRLQMAVVLDEYGGTMGIVTIEDILEELVGEIYDEHDEEINYHKKLNDSTYIFFGNAPLDNTFDILGIDKSKVEDFDASTVSGWVIENLGEIPASGKSFEYENCRIEVMKSTVKKVLQVKIEKLAD